MQGIFITGTDTGVGKTHVGCRLAAVLHHVGSTVLVSKPVESGCDIANGQLVARDALALQQSSRSRQTLEEISPYRFAPALAPARAARLSGKPLYINELMTAVERIDRSAAFLIVEGAGGWYSPLAEDGLNADLAQRLSLPVLLVASDRLGAINHSLLTLQAIETTGLTCAGLVLNQTDKTGSFAGDNYHDLSQLTTCPLLRMPWTQALEPPLREDMELLKRLGLPSSGWS